MKPARRQRRQKRSDRRLTSDGQDGCSAWFRVMLQNSEFEKGRVRISDISCNKIDI
jgi:hypothetical protein